MIQAVLFERYDQILRISPFSIVLLENKTKEISHETESFIHDFSGLPAPD